MPTKLTTIHAVIDALGGEGAIRDRYGLSPQRVNNWPRRGRIPPAYCFSMMADLRGLGFTADPSLWSQVTPKIPAGDAAAESAGGEGAGANRRSPPARGPAECGLVAGAAARAGGEA